MCGRAALVWLSSPLIPVCLPCAILLSLCECVTCLNHRLLLPGRFWSGIALRRPVTKSIRLEAFSVPVWRSGLVSMVDRRISTTSLVSGASAAKTAPHLDPERRMIVLRLRRSGRSFGPGRRIAAAQQLTICPRHDSLYHGSKFSDQFSP